MEIMKHIIRKEIFLTLLFAGIFALCKSQDRCLPDSTIRTDSLGNHKEKMAIPLVFNFHKETINVYMKGNSKDDFMLFTILEKPECNWNKDFSDGKTSYKVSTVDGKAKVQTARFNIIFKNSGQKYIELLYEGSEERIFTIIR